MTTNKDTRPLVGIVGPCASGKSTLIDRLKNQDIRTRHIAQEHSHVKNMWQRLTNPDILVYLDVSYLVAQIRRNMNWTRAEHAVQVERLSHAREHADLYILTDDLTPEEVCQKVIELLNGLTYE